MSDLEGRIASLEGRVDNLQCAVNDIKEEHRRKMDKIQDTLDIIQSEMGKNKGFFAGMVFATTAAFSVLTYVLSAGFHSK